MTTKAHDTAMVTQAAISAWAERRPERTESQRSEIARAFAAHLPEVDPISIGDEDLDAIRAAFIRRFDEDLPRTETLLAVAQIGRRIEARHRTASQAELLEALEGVMSSLAMTRNILTASKIIWMGDDKAADRLAKARATIARIKGEQS